MLLENSVKISLVVQFIIGLISINGLNLKLLKQDLMLRDILLLETIVQWIELFFYIYLSRVILLGNMTWIRYWDWVVTTPIMLITTMMFMDYNSKKETNTKEWFKNNKNELIKVVIANFLMLLFGYLGETNRMDMMTSFITGFIPFLYTFYIIYNKYVKDTNKTNNLFYWSMFLVWSLYGFGFLFNYENKNTLYNFLDIISKNFYGLFIYFIVKSKAI